VKRSRVESVSSVPPGDGVGENLEEGEIEEVIRLTKKEKRKRRKVNEAAQKVTFYNTEYSIIIQNKV